MATMIDTTPRCTTYPPNRRRLRTNNCPKAPGHETPPSWCRTFMPRQYSPTMQATVKAPSTIAAAAHQCAPSCARYTAGMMAMTATTSGVAKRRRSSRADALRHEMSGPTPVKNKRARPIGAATWLKNPCPTVIFSPCTASDSTGNIVPQNTAKASPTSRRLL